MTFDLVLKNGTLVNHDGVAQGDVGVRDGRIEALGSLDAAGAKHVIDVKGLHVLPGVIDTQVHFREPGMEHKEDLETGSRAAALGGVTAVFEMPNTKPPTATAEALADKVARATDRMWCDFAFFVGGTAENADQLADLERLPGCCGVKVFMGSSTGSLLLEDDDGVRRVLKTIRRRAAFHAEDEMRLRERRPLAELGNVLTHPEWRDAEAAIQCTRRLLAIARETGARVHVLHISTAEEMDLLAQYRDVATVETTPQHLTLEAPGCYETLGTRAQMNPPVRDGRHRAGIWAGLHAGVVDVLGSDHAPHTLEEKAQAYPKSPSGMPGVQTLVPVMLTHVNEGTLSLTRLVDLLCHGPQRIFGIAGKGRMMAGYDADFTVVDLSAERMVRDEDMASKCGWSPFTGRTLKGWPVGTIIRGRTVMWDGELTGAAGGRAVRFQETLPAAAG
ncbi:MAG: dihydroorotase [Alphaproteobacteria bacterium]